MKLHQLQKNWKNKPDNSILQVQPTILQAKLAYKLQNSNEQFELFHETIQCLQRPAQSFIIIQSVDKLKSIIKQIIQLQWCIVQVISQEYHSYKGFISWILIASSDCSYLIDAGTLHDQTSQIKQVMQNEKVIKFFLNSFQQLNALKRDYGIFTVNIFDLCVLTWYGYTAPQKLLPIQNSNRPLDRKLKLAIQKQFEKIWNLIQYLPQYLERNIDYLKQAFVNYNSADYILCNYHHHQENTITMNQNKKENKQNRQFKQQVTFEEQSQSILNCIYYWRQHTAKIMDISTEALLPNYYINQLASQKVSTVLQISQILSDHKLGMDQYSKILQAIKLGEQLCYKNFQLPKKNKNNFNSNSKDSKQESSNLRNLLIEIDWNDKDWLNRKNDQSIKLYKQIISIDEFDDSIAAPFINDLSEKVLKKYQISRYIKYAQYMRNGNQTKLRNYYNGQLKQMQQENQQNQKWNLINEESHQQEQSQTLNENDQFFIHDIRQNNNSQFNKQNNNFNLSEQKNAISSSADIKDLYLKPLPQNIEQIYLMAARVKKNYDKGQKSKKKTQKKSESKPQEFVPSRDELRALLDA